MAVKFASSDDGDLDEVHEINVTPFIDVILVLLIIFMVAAPLSTVDVNVDLPTSTAKPSPRPEKPLFLTIKSDLAQSRRQGHLSRRIGGGTRRGNRRRQGSAHLCSRRQDGPVWPSHGSDNLLRDAGYLKIGLVGLDAGQGSDNPDATDQNAAQPAGGKASP